MENTTINSTKNIKLSVVIPVYNEQDNIKPLLTKLLDNLTNLNINFEIIFIDDGSTDNTWQIINNIALDNNSIKGISLSRNFGHQHALLAGLNYANSKAIITMDGDLQHPPEIIPLLYSKWKQNFKIVNTIRNDKNTQGVYKRSSSSLFYKIFSKLTKVKITEKSSDFRLIDRKVLNSLLEFNDIDIFLRGAVDWLGFKKTTIHYEADKRLLGKTKYNFSKMFKFAYGAIISFSTIPLKIGIAIGLITSFLAFLELIYILINYISGNTIPGWASTIGIISFLFGILFIILGIIGIYISRIYQALQDRPKFIIENSINLNDK